MIKFNASYIHDDTIVYPVKLSTVLEKLCNQVGLELGSTEFINSDYMVLGNPFTNNEDCRTILSNIAQLAGGFARIGRDNKVYICTLKKAPKGALTVKEVHNMPVKDLHIIPVNKLASYRDSSDEYIDGMNYFEDFAKNNKWGEVNSLVISLSDIDGENTTRIDEKSIKENGLTEITIIDNYFLTNEEEREKVIEPLWENLKGVWYLPFKTKYYGYPYLDSGDMIAVDDIGNSQYVSYVFNHTFTFNGAFSGNIDTSAMTKVQVAYKNTKDLKSKFKRVERSVDKVNGKIEDIVQFEDEANKKLSQHQQTIDNITDTVSNVETKLENDYYTKSQTNSQISQSANSITSTVNSKISNAKDEVLEEANSKIEQTAESINSEVRKKVGEDEICSIISQSADEILLKGNRVLIESDNFKLDKEGNITATNANINGGNIILYSEDTKTQPSIKIINPTQQSTYLELFSGALKGYGDGTLCTSFYFNMGMLSLGVANSSHVVHSSSGTFYYNDSGTNSTTIDSKHIATPQVQITGVGNVLAMKELYNSSSGTTGTVSLTESCSSFQFLDISYCTNNSDNYTTTRVYSPNGKTVALFIPEASENLVFRAKKISISGSSMTVSKANYTQISSANLNIPSFNTTDYIKIVKVVGCK